MLASDTLYTFVNPYGSHCPLQFLPTVIGFFLSKVSKCDHTQYPLISPSSASFDGLIPFTDAKLARGDYCTSSLRGKSKEALKRTKLIVK